MPCNFEVPNGLPLSSGLHQRVIAAHPEAGSVLLNISQPMAATALVEVGEIKYLYVALSGRTSIIKVFFIFM